jgi:hypothetical protein
MRFLPILALLPFLYMNCSKKSSSSGDSGGTAIPTPGQPSAVPKTSLTSFTLDANNHITVYQDKVLNYSPSNGTASSYTIVGLPTWATFDSTTGTITGSPHKLSDTGTFTITDVTAVKTYGPYSITVAGDTMKEQEWYLLNTGQNAYALNSGTAGNDVHMSNSVAANLLGIGVRVAISDSGVYLAHPDLSDNILPNESRNYLSSSAAQAWIGDPSPLASNPDDAHGTAVAGLFAAKGWNGIGGRGVAPEVRFAGFLFLQAQDSLSNRGLLTAGLYDQFAGNFDIFNYSWGDPQCMLTEYEQSFTDKLAVGVTTQRGGRGSVYALASGNSYTEDVADCYPSLTAGQDYVLGNNNFSELNTTPYTINIAATNADGVSSSYSTPGSATWVSSTGGEFGWSKTQTGSPEASEPALVTTDYPGCNNGLKSEDKTNSTFDAGASPNADCNYTNTMNGTSGATPILGGAAAILLQANPNLGWRDIKYIFAKTADVIDANVNPITHPVSGSNLAGHVYEQGWITNGAGFHFQNWYGFGRINVDNAVTLAKNYTYPLGTWRTTGWKYDSGTISLSIPDNNATGVTSAFNVTDSMSIEALQIRISTSACASDLGLELTSPSGTKSIMLNINNRLRDGAITNHVFLSNAFYGESSVGTWTLRALDGKATCTAKLTNWKLNFFGH